MVRHVVPLSLVVASLCVVRSAQAKTERPVLVLKKQPVLYELLPAPQLTPEQLQTVNVRKDSRHIPGTVFSMQRPPARALQNPPGVEIAATSYDWQTNFLIKNRMVWSSTEKVMQLVWMSGSGNPSDNWPDRGTYYAVVDLTNPSTPSAFPTQRGWTRIEPVRTGWCAAAGLPNGALAFVSHTPLRYGHNQGVLDEQWSVTDFGAPGSLWPYLASTADGSLHVVYTYSSGDNAYQVAYRRSTDGGQTWSDEVLLSGPNAVGGSAPSGGGADAYIVETGGNTVAVAWLAANSTYGQVVVLRTSTDNGATWSAPQVLAASQTGFSKVYVVSEVPPDTVFFRTDTIPGLDGFSLLVDNAGKWHLAAALAPVYVSGKGVRRGDTVVPIADTSNTDTVFYTQVGAVYLEQGGQPVLIAPPGAGKKKGINWAWSSFVQWLKLGMDDEGKLYAVYVSDADGDTTEQGGAYGHLYLTAKVNAQSWTPPVNLTPNGIDCSFPTATKGGPAGYAVVAYQAGGVPGSFVQGGATWEAGKEDKLYVLSYALPTSVQQEMAASSGAQLRIHPNPVSATAYVQIAAAEPGLARLELCNALGMTVQTLYEAWLPAGNTQVVPVQTLGLASGVYYLKLHVNGGSVVRQMVVVR